MQILPGVMQIAAFSAAALSAIFAALFQVLRNDALLTLAITFGTIAYHGGMRLLVGLLYNIKMKNRADYTKAWYGLHPWEKRAYQFLRVKAWKRKMPSYQPELFSPQQHTWDEIAQAMCQAELVHETSIVLSFVPLLFSRWFGAFYAFLITSVCSAVLDLLFVIIQRYNRPRVIRLAGKAGRTACGAASSPAK